MALTARICFSFFLELEGESAFSPNEQEQDSLSYEATVLVCAGDSGYESSDSQGQPLVDYRELERQNLHNVVAALRKKFPRLHVKADFGVGEYDYYSWTFSVICRPNRDAL